MATTFTPEDLKIYGPEGIQFADAWGLTSAQLNVTLGNLLEVRPNARLTPEDLLGYHHIQYGMDADVTKEVIEGIQAGEWNYWESSEPLRKTLAVILADETTNALAQRIQLGRPDDIERVELPASFNDYFDTVTETDQAKSDVVSLYPREGIELEYRGRSSLHIGQVVIDHYLEDLTTYSDVLSVRVEDDSSNRLIVVSSSNSSFSTIQSLKLL